MRRLTIGLIAIVPLVAGGIGVWVWRAIGQRAADVLVSREAGGGGYAPAASPERFAFHNSYLDGRSAWFRERFAESRAALRTLATPEELQIECRVHREPFSTGTWLTGLDDELQRHRTETESNAMETELVFLVPGVAARDMLVYLAAAQFRERIEGEGEVEQEIYLVPPHEPPEGLDALPVLAAAQWLSRLYWKRPQFLARPTAIYHLNGVFRDGEVLVFVQEAWRNYGDEDCAPVRLEATQFAVVGRGAGSLVSVKTYYSGQSIPAFTDGIAARMTQAYYRKLAGFVSSEARRWKAPDEVVAFFHAAGC